MNPVLYWIDASWPGRLAISSRPRGGDWLENEVEGWKKNGIDLVVSLLTEDEVEDLELKSEPSLCETHGIRFLSFPIKDRNVPNSLSQAAALVGSLRQTLESGRHVAIHCRQGIGRSGVIAAAVLIAEAETAEEAIERVTKARGLTVPETTEQTEWLQLFSKVAPSAGAIALRSPT
jgi:protein-tyrosine phosphatase